MLTVDLAYMKASFEVNLSYDKRDNFEKGLVS